MSVLAHVGLCEQGYAGDMEGETELESSGAHGRAWAKKTWALSSCCARSDGWKRGWG